MSKVEALIGDLKKATGKEIGTIGVSGDSPPRLPTGIFQFDLATGGGIPMGRISVFYGPESSMKTTLGLKLIAQAQKLYPEKRAVFVDVEGHFDSEWATKMGVDCKKLAYLLPHTAEEAIDVVESLMYADDLSVIVFDSLAAMVTQHELDKSAEEAIVGRTGLAINKFYRKVGRALGVARMQGKSPTLVCINQIRFRIGVLHGDPETMPGGPAFKFASSMTVRLYGKDVIDKKVHPGLPAYKQISMILKKWKVPVVQRNCEFLLALQPIAEYGLKEGQTYDWNTLVEYLKKLGVLDKGEKGGWKLVMTDTGEVMEYKTQDAIKAQTYDDPEFGTRLRKMIVNEVMSKGIVVEDVSG